MADAFPLSGGIDHKAFPFLMAHLHRQGATGSLKVDGPSYQKAIYFRGGRVLFGSSNDPKDQLGAILIEAGRIAPEQLEEVNAKVGPGNPLAKVLSDSGFVNQRELGEAARTKVERILSDVISYESGSFEFEDGVLPKGAVDLKLSSEKLFLAAVRRIADRSFVLRHLEGLDAVLTPGAEMPRLLSEVQADIGATPQLFDGWRTVKEIAAEARVDEFDAAKIACALLFLGGLEKVSPKVLDLGVTARAAVGEPGAGNAEATLLIGDDAPPLVLNDPGGDGLDSPPFPPPEAPRPIPVAETMIQRSPDATRPDTRGHVQVALPAYTPMPFEEPPSPPVPAAPPSKDDLAALDELLNARNVEGPLAPMEKRQEPNWEPNFGQGQRPRPARHASAARPQSRRNLYVALAALLVLMGSAAAAWVLFFQPPKPVKAGAVSPAPPHTPPPITAPPSATPLASPPDTTLSSAPSVAPTPSVASPAPATTGATPPATTSPTTPPPTTQVARAASVVEAREAFRRGEYATAARSFETNLRAAGSGAHTVQVLVACSDDTLQKALSNAAAPELFIIPVAYQGRSCYRLCWGVFESEAAARSGASQVPAYFTENGAKPKVVTSASILP